MNIISNRCLNAYIYRDILNSKFENPFIWSRMAPKDYNYLFENYNSINFKNFMIDKIENKLSIFKLIIDDKFTVEYRHIIFNKDNKEPKVQGTYVLYNKPWELVVSNYEKRLKRMVEKPIFFYMDIDDFNTFKNYQLPELAKKCKTKVCIVTTDSNYKENEYVNIIKVKKHNWENIQFWDYIKKHHSSEIKKYIENNS